MLWSQTSPDKLLDTNKPWLHLTRHGTGLQMFQDKLHLVTFRWNTCFFESFSTPFPPSPRFSLHPRPSSAFSSGAVRHQVRELNSWSRVQWLASEHERVQKGGTEYLHKYYQSIPLIPCPLAETTQDASRGVQWTHGMPAFVADALNANKAVHHTNALVISWQWISNERLYAQIKQIIHQHLKTIISLESQLRKWD